jgi:hypothetical protein
VKQQLYTLDYSKPSGTVRLDKYDIPLPAKPPLKEFRNYGLPLKEQKFRRDVIPKTLLKRKSVLTQDETDFIYSQYHKRFNGEWWLIGGKEIYITGPYWWFLNYHTTEKGKKPEYRYIQGLVFNFKDMVHRDENCYGVFLIGPRRGGKTEITLGMVEEHVTRVKSVHNGMQSKNDTAAYENFKRITYSNKNQIWYMRPISRGSDDPEDKLEFMYPSQMLTDKRMRELAETGEEKETPYAEDELGSWLDYGPSKPGHYDRQELNFWILNEAGKLENMSLLECWDKVKPCLHYNGGKNIVGKGWFETTIEEIDDKQIQEIVTLVKDSNTDERNANGRTTSGLIVLFLSHADCYDEDEFGFPMREEAEKFLQNEIENLRKRKKYNEISNLLRKNPRTIEDALTPSGSQSAFKKEFLQETLQRLDFPEKFGLPNREWGIKGNLIWANGVVDGRVEFIPDENGKFYATQLPKDGDDNQTAVIGGIRYPLNLHKYRVAVDPFDFDLKDVVDKNRASLGGAVGGRLYDDLEDGAKISDGAPIDRGWEWRSKQPTIDYLARPEDSKEFFEDMIMLCFLLGTQMFVENNKGAIKTYFKDRGYEQFIMPRPESTMSDTIRSQNPNQLGMPANSDTIDQYFHAATSYIMMYCNANKHRRIILQLLELNKANRTKFDLGVAFCLWLIACEKKYFRMPGLENYEDESQKWFEYVTEEYE